MFTLCSHAAALNLNLYFVTKCSWSWQAIAAEWSLNYTLHVHGGCEALWARFARTSKLGRASRGLVPHCVSSVFKRDPILISFAWPCSVCRRVAALSTCTKNRFYYSTTPPCSRMIILLLIFHYGQQGRESQQSAVCRLVGQVGPPYSQRRCSLLSY